MYFKHCALLASNEKKVFVVAVLRPPFWKNSRKSNDFVVKTQLKVP
jgi:hypothetical protein